MQLYFIRHGQSENNALYDETGGSVDRKIDPDLTRIGHQQAQQLGEFLKIQRPALAKPRRDPQNVGGFKFTHIYSSLMIRALKTAGYVADALDMPITAWPEIHEGGGIYVDDEAGVPQGLPGFPRSYFAQNYPKVALPEVVTEAGWWNRPFEPVEARVVRAQLVVKELVKRHGNTDDAVALVSHGEFFYNFIRALLDIPDKLGSEMWFVMNNCAMSRIDFNEGFTAVVYVNRCEYLARDLIT